MSSAARAPRRVAITGAGLVNPFQPVPSGDGQPGAAEAFFAALCQGRSALRLHRQDDMPKPLAVPAAVCEGFVPAAHLGKALAGMMERFAQLGVAAAFDAWRDAGLPRSAEPSAFASADAGVCWGTSMSNIVAIERGYRDFWEQGRERIPPMMVVMGMSNSVAAHISIQLGLANAALTYSMACASGAIAIGEAFKRIREGSAKLMLAGGSDAPLAYGMVRAWEALRLLAPGDEASAAGACRPFDASRAGLVLGEGAAALVLEDWEHARARGARIYAELAGYGTNADHRHLVRPDTDGQVAAMRLALADAALAPDEVGYVNAHGTATREGDPIEIAAIRETFGPGAASLAVSATKAAHGHLMAGAGAIEALVTTLALHHDALPPTAHLDRVDEACLGVAHLQGQARRGGGVRAALSNSFAFGGSNAVLAFKALER